MNMQSADFTPDIGSYTSLRPFRYWCQKVLPLVYDDSLSYYELLCKVVDYLNKTMEDVNTAITDVSNLHSAYTQLQEYVNNYFDNLDIQTEINSKLDEMSDNGELSALIEPFIPNLVTNWLTENVVPVGSAVTIDKTLTISDSAADAKVVGDKFSDIGELLSTFGLGVKNAFMPGETTIPSGDYADLNTLPMGSVETYIGVGEYVSNKPETVGNIFTVITMNYYNLSRGGAVQIVADSNNTLFFRYASTEETYGEWNVIPSGSSLDEIYNKLSTFNTELFSVPYTLINDKFIDYNTGTITDIQGINMHITNFIPTNYGQRFLIKNYDLYPYDDYRGMAFYDAGFNFIAGYGYHGEQSDKVYNAPRHSAYVCFTYVGNPATDNPLEIYSNDSTINDTIYEKLYAEPCLSLFSSVGVIGDSYASGALTLTAYAGADHPDISWPVILSRKCGIDVTRYAVGGCTTRSWLTNAEIGLARLNSDTAKKLYILCLGINDNAVLGISYLGSISDIKSDPSLNEDTFYGNYGKIISAILSKSNSAKIVISTLAPTAPGSYVTQYNEAIRNIGVHFGIPVLEQGDDYFFTSNMYKKHIFYNHPTSAVYAHMANAFERMINKAMETNFDYFKDYGI